MDRKDRYLPEVVVVAAVLLAGVAQAQNQRENMVLGNDGSILRIPGNSNNASLVLRNPGGGETTILGFGVCFLDCGGTPIVLDGIGSNPAMNSDGGVAFKASGDESTIPGYGIHAMFNGDLTPIVISRLNGGGTNILGDTICGIEPMPKINSVGQIGFGADLDIGGVTADVNQECGDDNDANDTSRRKGIFRFTPPATVEVMIRSDRQSTLDTVFVPASSGMVGVDTTFALADTDFISPGPHVMNTSGQMVVDAYLDDDVTNDGTNAVSTSERDDRKALLRLNDPGDYDFVAVTGPPGAMFQDISGEVMNEAGTILFKGEQATAGSFCGFKNGNCFPNETGSQLYLWKSTTGVVEIAGTGDTIPGSADTFDGFSPLFDLNNEGNVAFVAGVGTDDRTGVFFYDASSDSIEEIARTTDADTGGFTSSFEGFDFDEITAVAALSDEDDVFFVAETFDTDVPGCGNVDGGELTTIFRWHPTDGLVRVVGEGDVVDGQRILVLHVIAPEMRDLINDDGDFIMTARTDPAGAGGCVGSDTYVVEIEPTRGENPFNPFDFFGDDDPVVIAEDSFLGGLPLLTLAGLLGAVLVRTRRNRR